MTGRPPDDIFAHVPSGPVPSRDRGERLLDLVRVMSRLRQPGGCPWDREQSHRTLARHLLEETHEVLEAIDAGDRDRLREELGDVLLQVVFHAQMAAEERAWDIDDVARGVVEKLIRRHPHVFGDNALGDSDAVLQQWDAIKAAEKKRGPEQQGKFKDLPRQLPALMFAQDVYKQIRKQGMDASGVIDEGGIAMTAAALASDEAALGKQLFEIAAACRIQKIEPESALRRYAQSVVDQLEALPAPIAD